MSRLQTIRVQQQNITAEGLCLDSHAVLPPENLAMGSVITDLGLESFSSVYPNPHLLDCIRWDDIKRVRSATVRNMSCLILEAESIADSQLILAVPCIPISTTRIEFTTGSKIVSSELAKRIQNGQIAIVEGDVAWLLLN